MLSLQISRMISQLWVMGTTQWALTHCELLSGVSVCNGRIIILYIISFSGGGGGGGSHFTNYR